MGNSFKEFYDPFTESFVDGYCRETNTVYECYGCYWHGCPRCYDRTKVHDRKNLPMFKIYGETMKKKNTLSAHYNVVTMWECFWSEIRDSYVTEYEKEVCNIFLDRELFFGGRTEVFQPYCEIDNNHVLEYHDVTSLYPFVCSHRELPIG